MKHLLKFAVALMAVITVLGGAGFAYISNDCEVSVDDGYATVVTEIHDGAGSCSAVENAYMTVDSEGYELQKASSGCSYYFTDFLEPGDYTADISAIISGEVEAGQCSFEIPEYLLDLNVMHPTEGYTIQESEDGLYFQASIYSNGMISPDAQLSVEIEGTGRKEVVSVGNKGVYTGTIDISGLEADSYDLIFTAEEGGKEAVKIIGFEILALGSEGPADSGDLSINVISPEENKQYLSENILVRLQVKDQNGLILDDADVTASVYKKVADEWIKKDKVSVNYNVRYYQETLEILDEGAYQLRIKATAGPYSQIETLNFYRGESDEEETETAESYGIYVDVVSPTSQDYSIGQEVPIQAVLKDSNGLFVTGNLEVTIFDPEDEEVETKSLEAMKHAYYTLHSFEEEGVYRLHFTGNYDGYKANKTALAYIETEPADANEMNVKIITPKPDVYPADAKLFVRARVRHKGEPVKNATVVAVVNEFEYDMKYDKFGEYYVKLPKLAEEQYSLTVLAKSGDLIGKQKSDFQISKNRLELELVYPEEGTTIFIKRNEPLTMSFNVYDEVEDIAPGAEVVVTFEDPQGVQTQTQIYQTETGEYTGAVFFDKNGEYSYTATVILPGHVPDSVDSNFSLDIEDVYVFGIEFETLLNIILIIAIVILAAGLLRRAL